MGAGAKFSLEQIITAVRALWANDGTPPLPNAVRKKLGGGDPDRLQFGISLVCVEYGINSAFLDGQPAEIRALVTDPRGPNGMLPLDPVTRDLLPDGALAGALAMLRIGTRCYLRRWGLHREPLSDPRLYPGDAGHSTRRRTHERAKSS